MRNAFRRFHIGLLAAGAMQVAVAATPHAVVDAVQSPAFLTRNNVTQPLQPGLEVRSGDLISTGQGAKAYLKLAEGSTVKLGESANLRFHSASTNPGAFFRGALDVAAGAFRFTTGLLAGRNRRDVRIRVGAATVGIRGTDVWGRSNAEKDLVCLIEGHVQISHPALAEPVDMADALTFFVADKGAAPQPVVPVDPVQLTEWATETDILPGAAYFTANGRSRLKVGDALGEHDALALYDRVRAAGYPASIQVTGSDAGYLYQVMVSGLASRDAARKMADDLGRTLGIRATIAR